MPLGWLARIVKWKGNIAYRSTKNALRDEQTIFHNYLKIFLIRQISRHTRQQISGH